MQWCGCSWGCEDWCHHTIRGSYESRVTYDIIWTNGYLFALAIWKTHTKKCFLQLRIQRSALGRSLPFSKLNLGLRLIGDASLITLGYWVQKAHQSYIAIIFSNKIRGLFLLISIKMIISLIFSIVNFLNAIPYIFLLLKVSCLEIIVQSSLYIHHEHWKYV